MSLLLALGLAIVLSGIVLHFIAASAFSRRIDALRATLPEPVPAIPRTDLPIVIARFAEAATRASQPHDVVHLIQRGEMRLDENSAWQSFTANQSIAIAAVGFVWAARMRMGRLLSMRILDSLVRRRGLLEARLFGSIRLARASGPEADKGE